MFRRQVAVGVEAADELLALVVEVALDLEALLQEVLQQLDTVPAEAGLVDLVAAVGDVGDHPGQGEAGVGAVARLGVVVATAAPLGVELHGQSPHPAERDLPGGGRRGGRQRDQRAHPQRVHHAPLEDLHAAHGAADDGQPPGDAQLVGHRGLGADDVADGDHREVGAVGLAGGRVDRRRPRGALATAQHVHAHDEVPVGVDRPAGADHVLPPPVRRVARALATGDVAVAGDGVAHQDGVRPGRVELAPGLVGDGGALELPTALQHEGPLVRQVEELAVPHGVPRTPGAGDRQLAGPVGHDHPHFRGGHFRRHVERGRLRCLRRGHIPTEVGGTLGVRPRLPDPVARVTPDVGGGGYPPPGTHRWRFSRS